MAKKIKELSEGNVVLTDNRGWGYEVLEVVSPHPAGIFLKVRWVNGTIDLLFFSNPKREVSIHPPTCPPDCRYCGNLAYFKAKFER